MDPSLFKSENTYIEVAVFLLFELWKMQSDKKYWRETTFLYEFILY